MFGHDFISGRVSISGVMGTSGIHPKAWLDNSDIKLTTAARGRVQGLTYKAPLISPALRALQKMRNGVSEAIFNGLTELTVDEILILWGSG